MIILRKRLILKTKNNIIRVHRYKVGLTLYKCPDISIYSKSINFKIKINQTINQFKANTENNRTTKSNLISAKVKLQPHGLTVAACP